MLSIETAIGAAWPAHDWESLAEQTVRAAIAGSPQAHLSEGRMVCEVAVRLTDDEEVRRLNAQYRNKDRPTNVLSFPLVQADLLTGLTNSDDGEVLLGDIVLAYGVCAREAAEKRLPLADHAAHLMVHGALHLVGYDHETEAEAVEMERVETAILAKLGIADPYAAEAAGR